MNLEILLRNIFTYYTKYSKRASRMNTELQTFIIFHSPISSISLSLGDQDDFIVPKLCLFHVIEKIFIDQADWQLLTCTCSVLYFITIYGLRKQRMNCKRVKDPILKQIT